MSSSQSDRFTVSNQSVQSPAFGSTSTFQDNSQEHHLRDDVAVRRRKNSLIQPASITRQHNSNNYSLIRPTMSSSSSSHNSLSLDLALSYLRSKLPAIISLAVGVFVGLIFATILSLGNGSDTATHWRGGITVPTWTHSRTAPSRFSVATPTLEQRFRVFELLSTLTGYHTYTCTRKAQRAYRRQVYERYAPLVGYDPGPRLHSHNGPIHLLQHILPGSKDPDRDFEGILDFKDHPTLKLKNRRSQPLEKDQHHPQSSHSNPYHPKAVRRKGTGHKYFFAINLYNSFDVIPDLFSTMFKVSAILGFQNVFVSVYENGSSDQTKALLRLFDGLSRSVGMRVVIRTSLRTRGAFHHRIEYLAEVRNAALAPLQELRDSEGELFDTVIFMNDVLPCVDDLLELIWQSRRQNAGITCGADYIFHEEIAQPVFYDNWVARDINGTALENAPFESIFKDPPSQHRFERHLPIQVQSCWNGIAILDPAPLYAHPRVRFRMAKLMAGECSASECSLICNDYWNAGYGRIVMVPRVKLAYDNKVWPIIHPERKNLTVIRGYTRLGGAPDDPTADPQDRAWFGPHDRLFRQEESEEIEMKPEPSHVWCWGWDGAGDLEGPDVEPVWEPTKNLTFDPRLIRHDRSFDFDY
ncbi:family 69 glycosyltransferase [Phakopsora pachyrhizi]|nr:family 69 glycosyltransferase [Phakopsora pachyrhizi]